MFRAALVVYLMSVTGAGPLLCCCTTARVAHDLTARAVGTLTAAFTVSTRDGTESCVCCACGSQPTAEDDAPANGDGGKPSRPGSPSCPCKERSSHPALVAPHAAEFAPLRDPANAPSEALWVSRLLADGEADDRYWIGEHPVMPFVTAEDILRAFHLLRC